MSKEEVYNIIMESKISDLSNAELNIILKHADRTNKGYICI